MGRYLIVTRKHGSQDSSDELESESESDSEVLYEHFSLGKYEKDIDGVTGKMVAQLYCNILLEALKEYPISHHIEDVAKLVYYGCKYDSYFFSIS